MSVMVSPILSKSYSSCSVSNWFLNSSWNSNFFDPSRVAFTLGGLLVINVFISISTSSLVVTSNVDLVDDYYVSGYILPVCYDIVNFGLRYTVWAFPLPPPLCSGTWCS